MLYWVHTHYTLSHHLENDRDVSTYSRGRRLSPRVQLVWFLHVFSRVQKGTPILTHTGCVLQRVTLGAPSDVTVVLWMRQSIQASWIESGVVLLAPD